MSPINPLDVEPDRVIAEALWHIDNEMEEIGWDQDAMLFAVMIHRVDDFGPLGLPGALGGVINLMPFPAWELALAGAPSPTDALGFMAGMVGLAPKPMREVTFPPDEFYGLAFATEAWILRPPMDGQELSPSAIEAMQSGSISEHPDRVEVRLIYCLPKDGGAPAVLSHERDGIVEALDDTVTIGGAIPGCLKELLGKITA